MCSRTLETVSILVSANQHTECEPYLYKGGIHNFSAQFTLKRIDSIEFDQEIKTLSKKKEKFLLFWFFIMTFSELSLQPFTFMQWVETPITQTVVPTD